MFGRFFFSHQKPKAMPPLQWLEQQLANIGLNQLIPAKSIEESQNSARVYYNMRYFAHLPNSLERMLAQTPAVNVGCDSDVIMPDGTVLREDSDFFKKIKSPYPNLLSPRDRMASCKKVICSESTVIAHGGYPLNNPQVLRKKPEKAMIISLAGPTFEKDYLQYDLFMRDPVNAQNEIPEPFTHLYSGLPTSYEEAKSALNNGTLIQRPIYTENLLLLSRTESRGYYSSLRAKNAVIFLAEAYQRYLLEDIALVLAIANEQGLQSGKPALLKATAVGMGFFAKIDSRYSIQSLLYPYYVSAYKQLLSTHQYPGIGKIEFPIFDETMQKEFEISLESFNGTIEVYQAARDVLECTEEEFRDYTLCIINPSDTHAYPGNEFPMVSVEAMIGSNTSLRYDQVPLLNPRLLDPTNHVAVRIHEDFRTELHSEDTPTISL